MPLGRGRKVDINTWHDFIWLREGLGVELFPVQAVRAACTGKRWKTDVRLE